jgi:hypothetical protein
MAPRSALPLLRNSFNTGKLVAQRGSRGTAMANDRVGIYRATVLNISDPEQLGRVQILVPSVSGQASGWAMPCLAVGASTKGVRVGDMAWVMFEQGNASYPVFMGLIPH